MLGFNFQTPNRNNTATDSPTLSPGLLDELRSVYFARLSAPDTCARRFGVSFERLAEHIAGAIRRPGPMRSGKVPNIRAFHLNDAALAAACVDDLPGAWAWLFARTEPALIAAAEVFEGRVLAVITVRRFFIELRAANMNDRDSRLNLRRYAGGTDLQTWLSNHIAAILLAAPAQEEDDEQRDADNRLRLAMDMLHTERRQARQQWEGVVAPLRDSRVGAASPEQEHG